MKIELPTEESQTELSVVPLVNVVFLLLVYFMLIGQVASPEPLDVRPPESTSGGDDTDQASVRILLTRDGQIAVGRVVVPASRLTERVAGILAEQPEATFQVKSDARVEAVRMIRLMERLRAAGVERLTLMTEQAGSR